MPSKLNRDIFLKNYEHELTKKDTIANPDNYDLTGELKIMACQDSPLGDEQPFVGWLHNQLGVGNNIKLRMWMRNCNNADCITVECEQHSTFEE